MFTKVLPILTELSSVQSPKAEEVIQSSVRTWHTRKKRRKLPTQSHSQGASEHVQADTMVDQEVWCTGTQNEELATAADAEEMLELHAEKDAFRLDFFGDADSDSDLESEDEY